MNAEILYNIDLKTTLTKSITFMKESIQFNNQSIYESDKNVEIRKCAEVDTSVKSSM